MYIILLRDKTFKRTGKPGDLDREFSAMPREQYETLAEAVDEALKRFEDGPQRYEPVGIYQGYVNIDYRVFDLDTLTAMHKDPTLIDMYMRAAAAWNKTVELLGQPRKYPPYV